MRKLGLRNLRSDDWVVMTAIPWYTLLVVSLNQIIFGGGSNYMTPEEIAQLTPESRHSREIGSKWVFLSEEVMVLTVWTCKVCMLLLYKRLMCVIPSPLATSLSASKWRLTTLVGKDWYKKGSSMASLSSSPRASLPVRSPSSLLADRLQGTGLYLLPMVSDEFVFD